MVRYDVRGQRFDVERRVEGLTSGFLGCSDADTCVEAIERAVTLRSTASDRALSDRLAQRVVDSGAVDVEIQLFRDGDALDAVVTYSAPVGSKAAIDTYVHPEWTGSGDRGSYRLVVAAEESMGPPPNGVELRRAPVDANGTWKTSWVYGKRVRDVVWSMMVDAEPAPIFQEIPGLAKRLKRKGLLDGKGGPEPRPRPSAPVVVSVAPAPAPVAPAPVAPVPVAPVPAPAVVAPAPTPVPVEPAPAPAPVPVVPAEPEVDDEPPPPAGGMMYTYDPRIDGAMAPELAASGARALEPGVRRCHQERLAAGVSPEGYLFADALVRADGWILSFSVYGEVDDPSLLQCVSGLMNDWSFPAWRGAEGAVTEVSVPYQFRAEAPGTSRNQRPR